MSSPGTKRKNSVAARKKKVRKSLSWRGSKEAIKQDLERFLQERFARGDKMERKREKIVTEIFASERRYLEQLDIVITYFMRPLQRLRIVPENDVRIMFGDLTAIQAINKELLAHMEEMSIGEAFLQLAPYIKLYSTYANNFEKAMDLLQEWESKTSDFNRFLREQESKPECRSLSLHALLITPIQRVPRYKLLLKQLLDHTQQSHTDYEKLKDALNNISMVTQGINEYIREHENFQKMLDIQKSLGGRAPKLLLPGRKFIKEGPLMKVTKNGSGSHERMFFLFSDILIYAKQNTSLERPLLAKPYTVSGVIQLQDCKVDLVFGEQRIEGAGALFKLSFNDDHLLLYSTNHDDALSWIDHLQGAINTHRRNRASLRTPSALRQQEEAFTRDAGRTPFPSSMRLRGLRRKQMSEEKCVSEGVSASPTMKDMLYPMRKDILKEDTRKAPTMPTQPPSTQRISRRWPLGRHTTPQPEAPPRLRRASLRPRSLPPQLPKRKVRRLQHRGPRPLDKSHRKAPREETFYEDARSNQTTTGSDDPDSTLYQTALAADDQDHHEIYPLTPSKERTTSYRRGEQVLREMPQLPAEQSAESQCVIL
ncbi:rho guanine nucleotide exchange factor 39-like [Diadema antillarum]|uniref:rho guanine nucleotide exchange factor 39-like n=1 Tax=Diadema antillarum TaxID=105358 RepID=UPI003A84604A